MMKKTNDVWSNLKEVLAVAAVVGAMLFTNSALESRIETRLNNVEQTISQLRQDFGTLQGSVNTLVEFSKPKTP